MAGPLTGYANVFCAAYRSQWTRAGELSHDRSTTVPIRATRRSAQGAHRRGPRQPHRSETANLPLRIALLCGRVCACRKAARCLVSGRPAIRDGRSLLPRGSGGREDAPRHVREARLSEAGGYLWIPFSLLSSIHIQPPKRLRDLLWLPATVRTSAAFQGRELGEVLLPVLNPFSWRSADPAIRLGRATAWEEEGSEEAVPKGQKVLLADEEEWPLLELRDIEFVVAQAAS